MTAAAGLTALLTTMSVTACSHGSTASGDLSSGPIGFAVSDPDGVYANLAATWNGQHPDQRVTITDLPDDPAQRRDQLVENLQNRAAGYDAFATDLSTTAELASNRWSAALNGPLAVNTSGLAKPVVAAASYHGTPYAVPLTADTGLLYFRDDLMKTAPGTWAALAKQCSVAKSNGIACLGGQYAPGADLAIEAVEAITGAGGSVFGSDGKTPTLTTSQAKDALTFLVDSYHSSVIPAAAITYQQAQSIRAFDSGSLLMLRANASAYTQLTSAASQVGSSVKAAALPGRNASPPAVFTGIAASIAAHGAHQKTAADFVRFLSGEQAQRKLLTAAGQPPALTSLYDDAALRSRYPFLAVLEAKWGTGTALPITPGFSQLSDALATSVYGAMTGSLSVTQALSQLQSAAAQVPST